MESLLAWLVPADLPVWAVLALIATACLTSAMTAALGIGGGVLLLAIMSMLLPAAAIIPLHGLVQLGSNANRAAFTAKHIRWQTLYWFAPGVVLGALLASALLVELPPALLQLSIASFILVLWAGNPSGCHWRCRNFCGGCFEHFSESFCRCDRAFSGRFY